ncbi:cupredoxin domain-containing protein [Candidatus Micrarchaeota archaeon]|nr:cupredoxin domain-containing protein [Candidatus Micrarchaeota archaeon]
MDWTKATSIVGIVFVGIFLLVAAASIVTTATNEGNDSPSVITGNAVAASGNPGVQQVSLSYQYGNYYPNTIRVKKGIPVRITVDTNTVVGCMKTIVIPEFGVRKTVSFGDNVIEFTPTKSGRFPFSCSMGMGTGVIEVEDENGKVADYQGASLPKGGSCGVGGGGCGCGRR